MRGRWRFHIDLFECSPSIDLKFLLSHTFVRTLVFFLTQDLVVSLDMLKLTYFRRKIFSCFGYWHKASDWSYQKMGKDLINENRNWVLRNRWVVSVEKSEASRSVSIKINWLKSEWWTYWFCTDVSHTLLSVIKIVTHESPGKIFLGFEKRPDLFWTLN